MSKKEQLMRAAEMLFRPQQLHEITLHDVNRRAGVGKGMVYRHFADKSDLFFQTALRGFDQMCGALGEIHLEGVPFREAILLACRTIREFFQKRRPLFRMILTEDDRARLKGGGLRQRWLRHRRKMTDALGGAIASGIDSGQVRSNAPPGGLAEYLLGMLRTGANELAEADEAWRSDEAIADLFLFGIGGTQAGAGKGPHSP